MNEFVFRISLCNTKLYGKYNIREKQLNNKKKRKKKNVKGKTSINFKVEFMQTQYIST